MSVIKQNADRIYTAECKAAENGRVLYDFIKRFLDISLSVAAVPVCCVIYIFAAAAIKLTDGGPVLYKSLRTGRGGRPFYIYKFRTMKLNADRLEDFLTPEELEIYKREYKLEKDPRVTGIGNLLRKTSLDEIPQILNVIKNDMSLIGPRPVLEEETWLYGGNRNLFLSVKPGITGYWQAYARNNAGYTDGRRQEMELYYVKNRSLQLDIKIFFATIKRVILRNGAY